MSAAAPAPDPVSANDSAHDPDHQRQLVPDSSEPCPPTVEEFVAKLVKEVVEQLKENGRPRDYQEEEMDEQQEMDQDKDGCNLESGTERRKLLSHYYGSTSHNTTVVVAALIVSSCFTALFQPPGSVDDDGAASLRHLFAFKFFFVSNGLAMVIACFSIFLLMTARPLTEGGSQFLLSSGRFLVGLAVHFALLAFFSAGYVVTGRELSLLSAVVVPVLASGVAFFLLYYAILVFQIHVAWQSPTTWYADFGNLSNNYRDSNRYHDSQPVPPDIKAVDVLQSLSPSLGSPDHSVPSPGILSSTALISTGTNISVVPTLGEATISGTPAVGDVIEQIRSPLSGKTPPSRSHLDARTPPSRTPLDRRTPASRSQVDGRTPPSRSQLDGRTPPSRSPLEGRTPISRSPLDGRVPPSQLLVGTNGTNALADGCARALFRGPPGNNTLVDSFTLAMNTPPRM